MKLKQNDIERLNDLLERGIITPDEANIEKVKMARVILVTASLPAQVRRALNFAAKSGELGHIKKDRLKPEAYFHTSFDYLARSERARHERDTNNAVTSVCV